MGKRVDKDLREVYEEEQQAIFDVMYDLVTVTDENGVFIRASRSCTDHFGVPSEEVIGHSCYELEQRGVFDHSVTSEVLRLKKEITLIQETKSGRRLMVTGKPLLNKKGELYRVVNVSRDVTVEKELEARLVESENTIKVIKEQIARNHKVKVPLLIGASEKMQAAYDTAKAVAALNVNVLIEGETGVGKGVLARYMHDLGRGRKAPFIQINCGAIPSQLMESELFGYAPGAFTGARDDGKIGLFEAAGKGTVFLDEISELSLQLQVKLLNVLQDRVFTRIGDVKTRPFDARVIAATNRNLKDMIAEGTFREDLYYRLNVIPINIPPLRERKEDIPLFVNHFVALTNHKYNMDRRVSANVIKELQGQTWPGNIRELENAVERLVITSTGDLILDMQTTELASQDQVIRMKRESGKTLPQTLNEVEEGILRDAFAQYGTTRKMAEALGINQSTVVKKMKKHNIK